MKTTARAAMVRFTIMLTLVSVLPAPPPARADAERVPSIEMISIKGGTFIMGAADGEFDDLGIGGFAAAAVDELVTTARSDTAEADDARAALALLLRLTDGSAA